MSFKAYRLGHEYRDTGSASNPEDEFLAWLNIPGSGMRNMPGIRPFKFVNMKRLPVHAFAVLVTHERSANPASNPWEDVIELHAGRIATGVTPSLTRRDSLTTSSAIEL